MQTLKRFVVHHNGRGCFKTNVKVLFVQCWLCRTEKRLEPHPRNHHNHVKNIHNQSHNHPNPIQNYSKNTPQFSTNTWDCMKIVSGWWQSEQTCTWVSVFLNMYVCFFYGADTCEWMCLCAMCEVCECVCACVVCVRMCFVWCQMKGESVLHGVIVALCVLVSVCVCAVQKKRVLALKHKGVVFVLKWEQSLLLPLWSVEQNK